MLINTRISPKEVCTLCRGSGEVCITCGYGFPDCICHSPNMILCECRVGITDLSKDQDPIGKRAITHVDLESVSLLSEMTYSI